MCDVVRLGVVQPNGPSEVPGHLGMIDLGNPHLGRIYGLVYIPVLQCVCLWGRFLEVFCRNTSTSNLKS